MTWPRAASRTRARCPSPPGSVSPRSTARWSRSARSARNAIPWFLPEVQLTPQEWENTWIRTPEAAFVAGTTLAWAARHGIAEIQTWTQRGNDAMRALNERLGYRYGTVSVRVEASLALQRPPAHALGLTRPLPAALDNALNDRALQRDFAADPDSWAADTYLSLEQMSLP